MPGNGCGKEVEEATKLIMVDYRLKSPCSD